METMKNGKEALNWLKAKAEEIGGDVSAVVPLMISDIEMPEMDGYTLTAEVKADPKLKNMHIILHTSLSGVFNQAMIKKVGADDFIAKFHPDELAGAVKRWLGPEVETAVAARFLKHRLGFVVRVKSGELGNAEYDQFREFLELPVRYVLGENKLYRKKAPVLRRS